jgi:hypothetical protein
MRWVRLGLRLSVGSGRGGLLRAALMSAGAALGVFVVLASLATVSVATAQLRRAEARTPVHEKAGTTGLQMIEIDDAIGGRPLRRTVVAGVTAGAPRPPGLAAYPAPGKVVVSPALAELIRTDPRAAERFPQPVMGTIGPAGLVAPDELRAYVGVPATARPSTDNDWRDWPVTGFGAELGYALGAETRWSDAFTPARFVAVAFALFVLVPYGVFLATCARLSASTRDRRLAALRLLGVSGRQAMLVNAIETGVVAGCGALAGLVAFTVLAPRSQRWHAGRLHWYAADISVPPGLVAAVVAATIGYAVAIGVLATRPARAQPVAVRRDAPVGRPSAWRAGPLLAGLAAAAVAGGGGAVGGAARGNLFLAAVLVTGLGVPLVVPLLGYGLAGLVRRARRTPVWLELATGRMRHAPGVAPRLVASLTAAIYVAGVATLSVGLFTEDQELGPGRALGQGARLMQVLHADDALTAALASVPGVDTVSVGYAPATIGGATAGLLVADCADVLAMYRLGPGESCVDGQIYRLELDEIGARRVPAGESVVTESGVRIPPPARTLQLSPRWDSGQIGELLVTRRAPAARLLGTIATSAWVVVADAAAADRAGRIVSARAPANALQGDLGVRQGFDSDLLLTILIAGLTVSFVLGIASFAAAAVDRTMERRRDNATLAVVGVSRRTATAGEVGFGALPLAIGLAVATVATLVIATALARLVGAAASVAIDRMAPVLWLAAAALGVGLVLIAVPAWLTHRVTAEHLRRP